MLERVIPLIFLSLIALANAEVAFEQKEPYDLSKEMSTLSALWAGDVEGDHIPDILVGGIRYEAGMSKGTLIMIRQNEISPLAEIPSTSRTVVLTVCDAVEESGREIVAGSNALYVYSRSGRQLAERSIVGDVVALLSVNFDKTGLDEIIYGTSTGDVVYLVDLEPEYAFSVIGKVRFILAGEDIFYVITSHSIYCRKASGEQLWSQAEKGEIMGALTYDINNDGKRELLYISGSSIYSLSPDGQQRTLVLTPQALPLSFVVEDVTQDQKPDLILVNAVDRLIVYSNLKDVIFSLFFRREADEIPFLYVADVTRDGKIDIVYGGINKVWVFENVSTAEEPITQGQTLFSQGEELLSQREYEKALGKFEEAKNFFIQMKEEEWAARCSEYIAEIKEIMEILGRAESAFNDGKELYSRGEFEEAKIQLQTALEEYSLLSEKDSYYSQFIEQAGDLIDQCDLSIADQYYILGEEALEKMQYQEAITQFEKAEAIYSGLGSEKAQLCLEKIEDIRKILREAEEKEQMNLLISVGVVFVCMVAMSAFLATRKKVSAKLEKGHAYLLTESQPKKSLQLMKEYSRLGYDGMVISRLSPEQVRKKLKKQKILQLSTATKEDSIPPDNVVNILLRMKEFMTSKKDSILLLDGLDYIAFQNTFEDALNLIQKLIESVILYKGILLVSVNPKSLEEKELVLLEEEMELLEL